MNNNLQPNFDPQAILRPRRKITGMSATLLPFLTNQAIDWTSFSAHLERTVAAGLIPAVNMDTGYANLLDETHRRKVLEVAQQTLAGEPFVAGAFVGDHENDGFSLEDYQDQIDLIHKFGGTPIIFQSFGLAHQTDDKIIENYQQIASHCDRFYAFELGDMFTPFGRIYSLEVYQQLLKIPACLGAKHSSLRRDLEWQRLLVRDKVRPDFMILTGNDLAIDMVMYGSDYLLGLSTFCPDLFARRDQMWADGDAGFYQLNDVLQYLGFFAFRQPTSAYKHSAAMFLQQRGWIKTDLTHPHSPQRPNSDRAILYEIGRQLGLDMEP